MGKIKGNSYRKMAVLTFFLLAAAGSLVVGVSAYLAASDRAGNEVRVGGVNIKIVEAFTPPPETLPGTVIPKDVKVKNLGPNDCYVRVMAVFSDSDMGQYCQVDWNTEDWITQADGYHYYKKPLMEGESTTSLFTRIKVQEDTPEALVGDFDVIVYGEGYQSEGYGTWQEAWKAYRVNKP